MFANVRLQMLRAATLILAGNQANAVTLVLRWAEFADTGGTDPNDESSLAGVTASQQALEFRALVHVVDHRLAGWQRFMEVQTGDIIIDYLADLSLDGKQQVSVDYNGIAYVQKSASKELLESWDVGGPANNPGVFRTLLLTPNG
jgi:hypothetical protein